MFTGSIDLSYYFCQVKKLTLTDVSPFLILPSAPPPSLRVPRAFLPRMEAQTRHLRTLKPLRIRSLSGAVADIWHVAGDQGGGGFYTAPDPRLVVFLDDTPPSMALKTAEGAVGGQGTRAFFVPAGVPLWSRLGKAQTLSHIDFHFDAAALQARLMAVGVQDLPHRAMFAPEDSALRLAKSRRPNGVHLCWKV
jgi:AraC family transcriptional regulator